MKKKSVPSLAVPPPQPGKMRISIVSMPANYDKLYDESEKPEKRSFQKTTTAVEADVKWLLELIAQDDQAAAKTLVEMGIFVATCVERLVEFKPELARLVAERRSEWPIVITQNPKYPVDADVLRASLKLESRSPRPFRVDLVKVLEMPSVSHQLVYNALVALDESRKLQNSARRVRFASQMMRGGFASARDDKPPKLRDDIRAYFEGFRAEAQVKSAAAYQVMFNALKALDIALEIDQTLPPPDIERIMKMGFSLAERDATNGEKWFEAVCDLILCMVGGKHADNKVLGTLGASGKNKFKKDLLKTKEKTEVEKIIRSGTRKGSEDHWVWEQACRKLRTGFNAVSPDYVSPA